VYLAQFPNLQRAFNSPRSAWLIQDFTRAML
jgi:hypothetical protein